MTATVTCPNCRREVPHLARCPQCDYPLVLVPQATQAPAAPHAPARRPGERPVSGPAAPAPHVPVSLPPRMPGPSAPPLPDTSITCPDPSCRAANPTSRTLCIRCGARLRAEHLPTVPVAPLPPVERPPSRLPRILAGVVAVLAVVGIGVWAGTSLLRGPDRPRASTTPSPLPSATQPAAVAIPPASITVRASSVQKPAGSIRYDAAGLLDGDPTTAWNSDGGLRAGTPMTVTFTFDRAWDVRSVTVLNGYQKTRPRSGKAPVDLFTANARPSRLEVRADSRKAAWDLADVRTPQTLKAGLGATKTVTFVVLAAHPGQLYKDVALSEVSFTGVPVG